MVVTWGFTLLDQGKKLSDGVLGPFCARRVNLVHRQTCRGDGNAEPHRVAIGNEHERGAAGLPGDRDNGEAPTEERMGLIRYLNLVGRWLRRIVEGGIMKRFRSIPFPTQSCLNRCPVGSATAACCGS